MVPAYVIALIIIAILIVIIIAVAVILSRRPINAGVAGVTPLGTVTPANRVTSPPAGGQAPGQGQGGQGQGGQGQGGQGQGPGQGGQGQGQGQGQSVIGINPLHRPANNPGIVYVNSTPAPQSVTVPITTNPPITVQPVVNPPTTNQPGATTSQPPNTNQPVPPDSSSGSSPSTGPIVLGQPLVYGSPFSLKSPQYGSYLGRCPVGGTVNSGCGAGVGLLANLGVFAPSWTAGTFNWSSGSKALGSSVASGDLITLTNGASPSPAFLTPCAYPTYSSTCGALVTLVPVVSNTPGAAVTSPSPPSPLWLIRGGNTSRTTISYSDTVTLTQTVGSGLYLGVCASIGTDISPSCGQSANLTSIATRWTIDVPQG